MTRPESDISVCFSLKQKRAFDNRGVFVIQFSIVSVEDDCKVIIKLPNVCKQWCVYFFACV